MPVIWYPRGGIQDCLGYGAKPNRTYQGESKGFTGHTSVKSDSARSALRTYQGESKGFTVHTLVKSDSARSALRTYQGESKGFTLHTLVKVILLVVLSEPTRGTLKGSLCIP